jgi:hypothetical protein
MGAGQADGFRAPRDAAYILDNAGEQASDRFNALSSIFDPGTIRHLGERGIKDLQAMGRSRYVPTDFHARQFHGLEKPRVDIRNEHMAGGADSFAQPSGYGSDSFAQFPRSSFSRC